MQLEQYRHAHNCSELALNAIGDYERDTECNLRGIRPAKFYALMACASEGLGMIRSALTEIALAAEEEPGDKMFEADVKRLKKAVQEGGLLFLNAEPDDPEWKIREDDVIEQGRGSVEDWKRPKREEKRRVYRVDRRV